MAILVPYAHTGVAGSDNRARKAVVQSSRDFSSGASGTKITADSMDLDMKTSTSVFETNVVVTSPEFKLTADRLAVTTEGMNEIESWKADGNVWLQTKDGEATCRHMAYSKAQGQVVMKDSATLRQPNAHISADRIVFSIRNGEIVTAKGTGNVQTSYPAQSITSAKKEISTP
jgi:lipopolysaccharide transport protein LptA